MRRNKTKLRWFGVAATALGLAVTARVAVTFATPARVVQAMPAQDRADASDASCVRCHAAISARYAQTPMARASGLAQDGLLTGGFVHAASGVRYDVQTREAGPTLHYERVVTGTGPALKGEVALRYFIGSNTRGRTYLFARDGLWFETPINWYSKRAVWDMAPAYESARSMPLTMPVDANCLHCHATAVQPSDGARNHFAGEPFQQGGIGCAACHGDSSAHVASGGRVATLNPATLAPARRDSICLQCHLEGDAVVYRAGHSLASFRPGDDLASSAVYFVDEASERSRSRASSQYEALLRSACKRATGDRMTCTTCHDPHGSPSATERVGWFRAKCLQCHTGEAMAATHHPEQQDCAVCHMPTRKTTDISHEQMTDHDIEARPANGSKDTRLALVDPMSSAKSVLHATELVPVGGWDAGARERGLAYAQYAARGDAEATARALSLLRKAEFEHQADASVHQNVAFLLQSRKQMAEAKTEYLAALALAPRDVTAGTNLAILEAGEGKTSEAERRLRGVAETDPAQTAAVLDLAMLQCDAGEKQAALNTVRRALVFNPDSEDATRLLRRYGDATAVCPNR